MSSKAISAATTHFLQFYIQYASITVIYWDYMLTIPNEVKFVWTKSSMRRFSTILYFLCRYYGMASNILYLLAISGHLGSNCNGWYKFIGALSVVARGAVLTIFTMRTYAMWSKNKFVLAFLGMIAATCFVLDCIHVPGLRCQGSSTIQIANTLLSILMCVFEFSSTVLTTFRAVQAVKAGGSLHSQRHTIVVVMLEQGILYFGLVTTITIAAVILNFRAPSGFLQRLLNAFILPVSGILTARFLLHVRAWNNRKAVSSGHNGTTIASAEFADDPVFARQSGFDRSVASEFGDDPVAMARSQTSGTSTLGRSGVMSGLDEEDEGY